MSNEQLTAKLKSALEAIETYRERKAFGFEESYDPVLVDAATRLMTGCHILLPPRPAGSSTSCPHCGGSLTVSLSK